jgi:peptidoglycan/LPS O-acetylase OafA/YrhL
LTRGTRLPGLDGLRAVAVIGVILFHAGVVGAELGWAGVELFFVISGFLITRILLDLRPNPRYLQTFYAHRALRILPVYYLMLLLSVLAATAAGRGLASLDLPFYIVYVQNYFPQIPTAMDGGIPLTSHTWTLAVEEQFYWAWPLVVLIAGSRALRVIVIGCIIGAPVARVALLLATGNPYAVVATLPAQIDALAVGAALALAERHGVAPQVVRLYATVALVAGALLVALLVATGGGLVAFADTRIWAASAVNSLLLSAFAASFGGIVALTVFGGGRAAVRILEWPPLVHIGRVSYGLYIYGPLALLLAALLITLLDRSIGPGGTGETVLATVLTYVLAIASWHYLETPVLRLRGTVDVWISRERQLDRHDWA